VEEISVESASTQMVDTVGDASPVAGRPTFGPLVVEEEDGCVVVRDIIGAVYGAGVSFAEAREDFESALHDHLRFLRERQPELDHRLRLQLAALERIFPGR
jgi:hypothetical protein